MGAKKLRFLAISHLTAYFYCCWTYAWAKTLKDVGNPTRDGIIEICQRMKANISLENIRDWNSEQVADIVEHSNLQGIEIGGSVIPRLIGELPIIAVMACLQMARQQLDAQELKVKETIVLMLW